MDIVNIIFIILGLSLFEIINSVDNAIINAEILRKTSPWARKWFLFWGLIIAVFIVRGLLPWLIVYFTMPSLGPIGALTATFSNDPAIMDSIDASAPILLVGGGIFLVFLFFHWLFMEKKNFGIVGERFFSRHWVWFYSTISIILCTIVWFSIKINPIMAFAAVLGSTTFFISNGFKQNAEKQEKRLLKKRMSDISKILYLEVIDATFSIDGVLGAFAFTLSVPLIILGNGVGALVVRKITVSNIKNIKKYKYLKNGAMYSILFLGMIMIFDAFGTHISSWLSPLVTFMIVGYFFLKSKKELNALNKDIIMPILNNEE